MKYFLIFGACLGDVFLVVASIIVLTRAHWLLWFLLIPAWRVWHQTGGLSNWIPSRNKIFLENWRRYGGK